MIGPLSFLAGVMLVGLVVTLPAVAARSVPHIGGVADRVGRPAGAAIGVAAVTIPLVVSRRLTITRRVLPFVVMSGLCEVAGFALFTVGSRHGIAISAVLASQFAAIAAVAAYLLFGERLARVQLAGVTSIVVGVGVLSALQS